MTHSSARSESLSFGPFRLFPAERLLEMNGAPVVIGSRALDILTHLSERAGEVVSKRELLSEVWPGMVVDEVSLRTNIAALRRALGDGQAGARYVENVQGRGYCLVAPVSRGGSREPPSVTAIIKPADQTERAPPAGRRDSNLSEVSVGLFGRTLAVEHARHLLAMHRIVTLAGPGGIGKTALALEVARRMLPTFDGDVWFVDLAPLGDARLVPSTVASVIGLQLFGAEATSEAVARAIAGARMLIVLDNCEHLIDAIANLADTLARTCPGVAVLATSREPLQIAAEHVSRVAPLDVPDEDAAGLHDVLGRPAAQLFAARMMASGFDFSPSPADLRAIVTICRRLDGVPLAIELAAAGASVSGLSYVAAHLDDRLRLLTGGFRTALPRQRTLRATIDWSYELLSPDERLLLRRLGVFAGGFELAGAAALVRDDLESEALVAGGIAGLVSKSLLAPDSTIVGRWRLLDTIRVYALERLDEAGERELISRRHAEFWRDWAATPQARDRASRRREIDNVRAALDWSLSPNGDSALGVDLTSAHVTYWYNLDTSIVGEYWRRLDQAFEAVGNETPVRTRMQLQIALAIAVIYTSGPLGNVRTGLREAFETAKALDDVGAQLMALVVRCGLDFLIGDVKLAQASAELLADYAGRTGQPGIMLAAARFDGQALHLVGRHADAQTRLEAALGRELPSSAQEAGPASADNLALVRALLARVCLIRGALDQARALADACRQAAPSLLDDIGALAVVLMFVARYEIDAGDLDRADQAVDAFAAAMVRRNMTQFVLIARYLDGQLLVKHGDWAAGIDLLRSTMAAGAADGWKPSHAIYLGSIAEGLVGLGRTAEALDTIEQALALADDSGEGWCVPELLRIKGDVLAAGPEPSEPAAAYGAAINLARTQGALFWELRAATSLARLRIRQDRRAEAQSALSSAYDRFTEGFEAPDLVTARTLLSTL